MDSQILLAAATLGLIPAVIGKRKGYSFLGWWAAGFVLFIAALPWVLLVKPNPAVYRTCPHCQERTSAKATACPHCARDLPPLPAEYDPARRSTSGDWPVYAFVAAVLLIAVGLFAWAAAT